MVESNTDQRQADRTAEGPGEPVHIFWTGGWDSTFRICQLTIELGVEVQPIFVHSMREAGGQRLNVTHELQAIEYIRHGLGTDFPAAGARLRRLSVVSQAELYCDDSGEVQPLRKTKGPGLGDGWQYSMLGSIARRWGQPIELSIEKSDDGHNPVGDSLIPHVEPFGHTYRLRPDLPEALFAEGNSNSIANFRHFHFPLLFTTRPQMLEIAREGGYEQLLLASWSCTRYRPNNDQCGKCFCCRGRERDGVWIERPFARWE